LNGICSHASRDGFCTSSPPETNHGGVFGQLSSEDIGVDLGATLTKGMAWAAALFALSQLAQTAPTRRRPRTDRPKEWHAANEAPRTPSVRLQLE
jgi:hypothetical protein